MRSEILVTAFFFNALLAFAQTTPTDAECCAQSANYSIPAGMTFNNPGVCSSYSQCVYSSLWDWYGVPFYSDPRYGCCRSYTPFSTGQCAFIGHCVRKEACPFAWVGGPVTCKFIGLVCCKSDWLEPSNSGTFSTSGLPTTTTPSTTTTATTTTTTTTEPTTTTTTTTEEPTTTTTTTTTTTSTTTTTTEPTTTTTTSTTETTTTTTEPTTTTTEPTTTTTTTTEQPTTETTLTTEDDPTDDPAPSSTAVPPASPPASCSCRRENALLTHDEAMALFNASGIAVTLESYYPGCTNPVPGCLSLHAVRSSSVLAVIGLFEGKNCALTLVEGVEPGHPTYYGLLSTAHGHFLGVKSSACVDRVVRLGTALTAPRGFSRSCAQTFAHSSSTWCLTTAAGGVWLAACRSWVGVDRTREPFECGDNETLAMCTTTVNSLQLADGSAAFADDFGYLQRHGAACPCAGGVVRAGGPFAVSAATFAAAQEYLSGLQDTRLIEAVTLLLNDVDFLTLPYQATSACLISALTVRLDLLRRGVTIADDDEQQLAAWQSFSPPCGASDFTKEPPADTTVCRSRIGLVLDASSSMGSSNFNSGRTALRDFARSAKLSSNSYVSLVTYGTAAVVNFNWTSPSYAGALIPSAAYLGGSSNTHAGLAQSVGLFPSAVTPNELPVVIVVTNGRSANSAALSAFLSAMPSRILRYAVGVGSRPSTNELRAIAGSSSRVYRSSSFSRLPRTLTKLMTALCAAPRPVAPPQQQQGCGSCKTLQQLLRNERRAFTIPVSGNGVAVVTLRPGAGCVTVYASTRTESPGPATYEARATTCAGRGFGSSLSLSTRGWGLEFWKLRVQRWMLTGALPGPDEFASTHGFRAQEAATVYAVAVAEETSESSGDASLDFYVEEHPAATMAFEKSVATPAPATTTAALSPAGSEPSEAPQATPDATAEVVPVDTVSSSSASSTKAPDAPAAANANGGWFLDFDGKSATSAAIPLSRAHLVNAVVVTAMLALFGAL